MAQQKPPHELPSALLSTPCCQVVMVSPEAGGLLEAFVSSTKMVLGIVLFLGICAFMAYVALLCIALLIAAIQVVFHTLIPLALLILQFLLSTLLLLFCMQWASEILAQQFRFHDPVF